MRYTRSLGLLLWIYMLMSPQRSALAQTSALSEFTAHSIGDTLALFSDVVAKSNMLLFVNPTSCFTCDLSIENYTSLSTRHNLSITLFIEGASQTYADTIRKHNAWTFPVVGDPLRAYEKFYAVKTPPFFYMTDTHGRIMAMDKIAGHFISIDTLNAILSRADAEATVDDLGGLSVLKRIHVHNPDGSPLTLSPRRSVSCFRTNSFAILDCTFRTVHVVDSTGRLQTSYDLRQHDGRVALTPTDCSWLVQDTLLLISGMSVLEPGMPTMFVLNLVNREFKPIPFDRKQLPPNCKMFRCKGNPYTQDAFVTLLPYMPNVRMPENQATVAAVDSSGRMRSVFGTPDSVLSNYVMSRVTDDCLAFDGHRIYECQSPTRSLNIYDSTFTLLRHVNVTFGAPWFEFKRNFPQNPDMAYWLDVNAHISWTVGLYPSIGGNELAICYANAEFQPGETDPKSPTVTLKYYIHRIDDQGRWLDDKDILLPLNARPFHIDGNVIAVQEYTGNHLDLVWYEAKRAERTSSLIKE